MKAPHLEPGSIWLDTARPDAENRRSLYFTQPREVHVARCVDDVLRVLEAAERARRAGAWIAGFLSYEAAGAWLPTRDPESGSVLAWLGEYDAPAAPLDLAARKIHIGELHPQLGEAAFSARVAQIRALIHEGDVYQINFTFPITGHLEGQVEDLYRVLRKRQPVPYGAVIQVEGRGVASLSPELFFRVEGRRIWSRPMKGTMQAGRSAREHHQLAARLSADAKNRAENLMIVDLLRNDVSRITEPGSVRVPALFETEHHPTVVQMTSTVEGRLSARPSLPSLFEALFPCGSVTGAPKHRAMQRIAELESGPRGVYCGAIGYASPDDEIVFNVPIRTIEVANGALRLSVGSGIVWDSEPADEYRECLLKARFLTDLAA